MSFNWETGERSCQSFLETPMGRRPCCAVSRRLVAFSQKRFDWMGEREPTFAFAHAVERIRDREGTQMPKNDGFLTKRLQVRDQANRTKSQLETPNKGEGS